MKSAKFAIFRIVFGLYLTIHFGMLIPWAAELFSREGIIADPALNPMHGLFPNPLVWWDSAVMATGFCVALTLLSVCYTLGIARRSVALLLWFGSTALMHRNNLIVNPSLAYLGLLLVLSALIPADGKIPHMVLICAWVLLAFGYTFSGIVKLDSLSWQDGSAIARLLENPLARDWPLRLWMLSLPPVMLKALTWGSLALELLYLPLCLSRTSRKYAWLLMVLLHLGIMLLVDFADLTVGMLMAHFFVFDPSWLPARWLQMATKSCSKTGDEIEQERTTEIQKVAHEWAGFWRSPKR